MPLSKFEHVLILAADLEATKAFYVDVLGLAVGKRPPFPFPGYWLYLGDSPCIHLAAAGGNAAQADYLTDRGRGAGTGPIDHVAFVATDLVGLTQRLERLKVPVRHREVPEQGLHQVFVDDPNGVTVELNFPAVAA